MKLMDKATTTFQQVRDSISPTDHPIAWRKLFSIPLAVYAVFTVDEIITMLKWYDSGDERALCNAVAVSLGRVHSLLESEEEG